MALSHIGSEARVSSISPPDGSVEAGHCASFYDAARTEMIEPGNWAFALKRAELAQVTNLDMGWLYAYALPSNCMRALRVLRQNTAVNVFAPDGYVAAADDSDSAEFTIEGEILYCNQPDAVLVYVVDVTDTTKFTPSFTTALGYLLASYLAGPIIKGNDGMRVGDALRQRAMTAAEVSATASANASSHQDVIRTSIQAVRA